MKAPDFLARHASHIETVLAATLDQRAQTVPATLLEAMRYSLLAGGKRIRPALLLECFAACGGKERDAAMPAAASIECLHTYSLIHDDLPCMDDDDLRRGMPTCHKKFDEATAVLAADALQALSFELLTELATSPETRVELVRRLAIAAGAQGMVGGQQLDIEGDGQRIDDVLLVERIHLHKTGALLCYACEAGAILAAANAEQLDACSRYGKAVGLLFQVADDILDATADDAALGKTAGKDAAQNKATYVSVLGLQKARELADEMRDLAIEALAPLGKRAEHLRQLADYILERGR